MDEQNIYNPHIMLDKPQSTQNAFQNVYETERM